MTEQKDKSNAGTLITTTQLSKLLDLTPRRIQQLVQAGVITKADRDRYPLVPAIQGYLRWLADEGRRSEQVTAASRVADNRAQEIELRIARRMQELIPLEDAQHVLASTVAVVRAELAKLPGRLPPSIRPTLKAEIDRSIAAIDKAASKAAAQAASGNIEF